MKFKGKQVKKAFSQAKEETMQKCLSAINQLEYNVLSYDIDSGFIAFQTKFGAFNFKTNGDYLYRCSITNIEAGGSQCIIWCEECSQPIPIFEILTNQSCKYSQRVLDLM